MKLWHFCTLNIMSNALSNKIYQCASDLIIMHMFLLKYGAFQQPCFISHISSCSTPILDPVLPMPKLCGTAMTRLECRNFCGRTQHCKAGKHRQPTSGTSHTLPPLATSSRLSYFIASILKWRNSVLQLSVCLVNF